MSQPDSEQLINNVSELKNSGILPQTSFKVSFQAEANYIEKQRPYVKDQRFSQNFLNLRSQQTELEKVYLQNYKTCSERGITAEWIQDNLDKLDLKNLENKVNNGFLDSANMEAMMCVASSLVVYQGSVYQSNERIRDYLANLYQFGDESVSGAALSAKMTAPEDKESHQGKASRAIFVIKAPRDPRNANELMHEVFVGFSSLNKLRSKVPNFADVYGMFNCSPPFIDPETKEVVAWCNRQTKDSSVAYAIYQNIAPAVSFEDFNKGCSAADFVAYFSQILLAENQAVRDCDFTHYDLHTQNVLLRKTGFGPSYIPYDYKGNLVYVYTPDAIATVIDYGTSFVRIDGKPCGTIARNSLMLTQYNVSVDKSNPLYDIYKLLCFSLLGMYQAGNEAYEELAPLLLFFGVENNITQSITQQRQYIYMAPFESTLQDLQLFIDFFMTFCEMKNWNIFSSSAPSGTNVITVQGDEFGIRRDNVLLELGIPNNDNTKIPSPISFLRFVDTASHYNESRKHYINDKNIAMAKHYAQMYNSLVINYINTVFESSFANECKRLEKLQECLNEPIIVRNFPVRGDEFPTNYMLLKDCDVYDNYKSFIASAFHYLDTRERLITATRSLASCYNVFMFPKSDTKYKSVSEPYITTLRKYDDILLKTDALYQEIKTEVLRFKNIMSRNTQRNDESAKAFDQYVNELENNDEFGKFVWYLNTADSLDSLLKDYNTVFTSSSA